jgi:hypothetical protein
VEAEYEARKTGVVSRAGRVICCVGQSMSLLEFLHFAQIRSVELHTLSVRLEIVPSDVNLWLATHDLSEAQSRQVKVTVYHQQNDPDVFRQIID